MQGSELESWIRELIRSGKLYRFYKTREWLELKAEVMSDHRYECARCLEKGRYSRADTVHHEYEVKRYPRMALTRWVEKPDGTVREVLVPLCNRCHNEEHDRFSGTKPKPQLNEERW